MAQISESKGGESSQVDDGLGIDYADNGYVIADDQNLVTGDELQGSSVEQEVDENMMEFHGGGGDIGVVDELQNEMDQMLEPSEDHQLGIENMMIADHH